MEYLKVKHLKTSCEVRMKQINQKTEALTDSALAQCAMQCYAVVIDDSEEKKLYTDRR